MQKYKFYSKSIIFSFFGLSFFIILFNYIVDPYQIYRKTSLYTFKIQDQRYLNAGLARNYPYDTLIVGSSMIENFYLHDIKNNTFKQPLKLSFQGGGIYELNTLINLAIHSNKKLKNIIIDFDMYAFNNQSKQNFISSYFPNYLYNSSYIDDTYYLLNFKILRKSFRSLKNKYNEQKIRKQLDNLYSWQNDYKDQFTIKNVLSSYKYHIKNDNKIENPKRFFNDLKINFNKTIYKTIKNNPNICFYIFYPPYSIYGYKAIENLNKFDSFIKFKKYTFEKLLKYKNVKIYDFQTAEKIILNIKNYKDIYHYHENINKWMLKQIQNNNFLVTQQNYHNYLKKFKSYKTKKLKLNY